MSKKIKIWLVSALALVLVGGLIFVSVMTALRWDFTKLSTNEYVTNTYEITEDFSSINISVDTEDVVIMPSTDNKVSVTCFEQEKLLHSVAVKNGALTISVVDTREWHDYVGINFGTAKITVGLPATLCLALDITVTTGDVTLKEITANDVKIKTSTGDICLEKVSCNDLSVEVSTGDTHLEEVACKNLTTNGNTGDIELIDVIASAKISIERTTGDVTFDSSDANEIKVNTTTGDVEVSLLTGKVFDVKTSTGEKQVPNSTTGGSCKITTSTGDIKITVK